MCACACFVGLLPSGATYPSSEVPSSVDSLSQKNVVLPITKSGGCYQKVELHLSTTSAITITWNKTFHIFSFSSEFLQLSSFRHHRRSVTFYIRRFSMYHSHYPHLAPTFVVFVTQFSATYTESYIFLLTFPVINRIIGLDSCFLWFVVFSTNFHFCYFTI